MSQQSNANQASYIPWPPLPYTEFAPTAYLLHMGVQAIGKMKLTAPFEPHWDSVPLWVTATGLSSGPIPYGAASFSVDMDFIEHELTCKTSWGAKNAFALIDRSVAEFTRLLFKTLNSIGVEITINTMPQEVTHPIPFEQDTQPRPYQAALVNAWWSILLSSQQVMERYHARFLGRTPPIGLMWGTFDLRDVRYGKQLPVDTTKMGVILRNAMDAEMIEIGWWPGNEAYPDPAYFSFAYPQPEGIAQAKIESNTAKWHTALGEFILNYEDVRNTKDPSTALLAFFESTYQIGAKLKGWDPQLVAPGRPA